MKKILITLSLAIVTAFCLPTALMARLVVDEQCTAVAPFEEPEARILDERLWLHPQCITIYRNTIVTCTTFGKTQLKRTLGDEPFTLHKGETAVVDLGQNMVGWMFFKAKAKRGTVLTMRHSVMLNHNGDCEEPFDGVPGDNLHEAKATQQYTFSGYTKGEAYHPSQSIMGFRYVSITATDDVTIQQLIGQAVDTDM